MRHHRSIIPWVTSVLLVGLAGCAGDSPKSASDTVAPSAVVQAEEGKEQPASGEVQERAVIRDHRTQPGPFTPSQTIPPPLGKAAPQPLIQGVVANPPAFGSLPGEFAIRTMLKGTYLTARDGGHHSIDAVITAATNIGPYEKFRLAAGQPDFTTIQTAHGYYLSAVGGMGGQYDPTQVVQTEATSPQQTDAELLRIHAQVPGYGGYTIQTFDGYFLTALGGGGKSTGAFHSDARNASTWEYFNFVKCNDLGSGYDYVIMPKRGEQWGFPMLALNGGGRVKDAIGFGGTGAFSMTKFNLIRQSDGSYALQTSNRINYVTAIQGGGLAHGEPTWDNLVTDRTQVQAWEQFKIVDQGDCTYTIQTLSGWYVGVGPASNPTISTRISDPNAAESIGYTAKFMLAMWRS